MKKVLTAALLLTAVTSFSQRRKQSTGYVLVTPQFGFYKNGYTAGGAFNVGEKIGKMTGIGLGAEVLKFKDVQNVYVPVYADFRYFFAPAKGSQFYLTAQPGYGFYNDSHTELVPVAGGNTYIENKTEDKGGFYFGAGLGVRGSGKVAPVVSVRYTSYAFDYTSSGAVNAKADNRTGAVTVNFGIAF